MYQEHIQKLLDSIIEQYEHETKEPCDILRGIISKIQLEQLEQNKKQTENAVVEMTGNPNENLKGCEYIMKSGKRRGNSCGKKVIKNDLCRTHCPKNCKVVIESGPRKGEKCNRLVSDRSTTGKYCMVHMKNEEETLVLRLNKWGQLCHTNSGLVFQNKMVIGKQTDSGDIVKLLEDIDFECILEYGFKMSPAIKSACDLYQNRSINEKESPLIELEE